MISRIELNNVLAFRYLCIEARALTLLSGTNSSGKSSILHSLAMLRQSDTARMLPSILLLNGSLVTLGIGRDVLHSEFSDLLDTSQPALRIALVADGESLTWTAAYEHDADTLRLLDKTRHTDHTLFADGFQYLQADRIAPAVTYPKSHEAVSVEGSLGPRGQHSANYLRVHGERAVSNSACHHPGASGKTLLEQTNAWLAELSVGTTLEVSDVEGTDLVRLVFRRVGSEVPTEPQRATNVGFGLSYALPIIVACLTARPGSLMLVENPEAHLHPSAQAALGRLCAGACAGGAQVILETHSDHILNSVRLSIKHGKLGANSTIIHFLSRIEGQLQPIVDTITVGEDGMIDRWPGGFFDEMDRAIDALLD